MNCNRASHVFSLFLLIVAIPNFANAQSRTKNGDIPGSATYMPTPEHPVGWRGDGKGRYPAADPPTVWGRKKVGSAYESRNIVWSTRMPAVSVATPIVVGDRIFVTAEVNDLVCLDKKSGKVLWIRSNAEFEGMNEEERKESPELAQITIPLLSDMDRANDEMVSVLNSGDSKQIEALATKKKDIDK